MSNANLPGDWNPRGTIIVTKTTESLPRATRIEVLRAVAGMIRRGQTLTVLDHAGPTGEASPTWTRIVGEHFGYPRSINRAIARNALKSFAF